MAWAGDTALSHPGDINTSCGHCCGQLGAAEGRVAPSCPEIAIVVTTCMSPSHPRGAENRVESRDSGLGGDDEAEKRRGEGQEEKMMRRKGCEGGEEKTREAGGGQKEERREKKMR